MNWRAIIQNSLIALFSVIFTLSLLEIGMRLFYEPVELFVSEKPEDWNFLAQGEFTPPLNSFGFREEEITEDWLQPEVTRILFLGDSFTFGHGVKDGADLFPEQIERQLNTDQGVGSVHIYNAGRPGTEPRRWVNYLEKLAPVYQPNAVVAVFFLRDGTELCTSFWCHEAVINSIKSNYTERLAYKYSYIGRMWFNSRILGEFSAFYADEMMRSYLGNDEETAVWQEQQKYLLQIRDIANANGAEFHLVIFPVLYNLNKNYPFLAIDEEIIHFAQRNNIPVYSLTHGFIGQDASELWVSVDDQHPNGEGHKVAADTLYPYVHTIVQNVKRTSHRK